MKKINWPIFNFFSFFFVFYLIMSVAAFIQVIYFQQQHALLNFGYATGIMAIAGAITQAMFGYLRRLASQLIILSGFICYCMAFYLRIFPTSMILSILSGIFAGYGATVIIVYIRLNLMQLAENQTQSGESIISRRYTVVQIATLIGTAIAGMLMSQATRHGISIPAVMITLAIMMGLLVFWPKNMAIDFSSKAPTKFTWPLKNTTYLFVAITSVLLGALLSTFAPLIPAMLGVFIAKVSLVSQLTTISSLLTLIGSLIISKQLFMKQPLKSMYLMACCTGVLAAATYVFNVPGYWLFILAWFSLWSGMYIQLKEVYEFNLLKNKTLRKVDLIAVSQTAFLVGDSIGTPIASVLLQDFGLTLVFCSYGAFSIIVSVVLWRMWRFKIKSR